MQGWAERALAWYFRQRTLSRGKGLVGRLVRRFVTRITCTAADGSRFEISPRDLTQVGLLFTGEWEPDESAVLRRELKPGAVFYDIGANIGYFSVLAARVVGERGRVLAFEPNPEIRRALRRNLELNGLTNVTVFPYALADREASLEFNLGGERNSGLSSLRPLGGESRTVPVRAVRLDRLIAEESLPLPDFIKMDIEGAEYLALRGMEGVWRSGRGMDLLIEVSDPFLRQLGGSEAELLEYLHARRFVTVGETSRHSRLMPDGKPLQYVLHMRREP